MSITETSLKRPAFITMVIMGLVVLGLFSYSKLGVDLYPNVNFPVVVVTTTYPGASPQEVETEITKEIEEAVGTIAGIDQITSTSLESVSSVVIQFKLESNLDTVAIDVQKKIDGIRNKLPDDIDSPVITKADIQAIPIMTLSVTAEKPGSEFYFLVKDKIKPMLERINGVARVDMSGEEEREIQIQLHKNALRARGLTVTQVLALLQADNLNIPAGKVEQGIIKTDLRVLGQFKTIDDIKNVPLRLNDGSIIPLSAIATVRDTHKELSTIARTNGRSSISLSVTKQSDASVVKVAAEVREALKEIEKSSKEVSIKIISDNSIFINGSLRGIRDNLLEGILFTALILLFFLRSVPSTLIVLLAIPTSLISTMTMLYFFGFTLNVMTLMALSLTIGILVDDSIVVLENIHRHLEMGEKPFEAALRGRMEIGQAAIAITLVDVVVFLPIAFMGGILGQFFKPFALTIVTATLCSLFVSFTLTPMLGFFFLRKEEDESYFGVQWLLDLWENSFQALRKFYKGLISWSLENKGTIIAVAVCLFVLSISLIPRGRIGAEFMPATDEGEFTISITLPVTTPLLRTDEVARQVEKQVKKIPELKDYLCQLGSVSGGSFGMSQRGGTNAISIQVIVSDIKQRKRSIEQIMAEVRKNIKGIPGATIIVQSQDSGGGSSAPVEVEIYGNDFSKAKITADQILKIVQKVPGTVDVRNSWVEGKQEAQFIVDRRKAQSFGLTVAQIANAMRTSVEGVVISRYREENREADIRIMFAPEERQKITDVYNMPVATVQGKTILLSQVASLKRATGPVQISRKNRQRRISISANVLGRSSGLVNQDVKKALKTLKLPEGVSIGYGRADKNMQESFRDLLSSLMLSILLVYMLMVALYESYRYPFIILFSLPLALIGGLYALSWTGRTLNIFSLIGVIMLMGLVAKNAILIVDFTNKLRAERKSVHDSLVEAGSLRLRPIMMTTLSMVFGMLPLAMAIGEGAEIRAGLATVIIGGLLSSLFLTLVVVPVVYDLMESRREKKRQLMERVNNEA